MLIVIFFAIGIHEFAHAKAADMAGDPTPRMFGRVTLNLFNHFELMGTIMIIITSIAGVGIGWGKPVPMDSRKMNNPRWDHFTAVLAGPVSNLIQAALWAIVFRLGLQSGAIFFVGDSMLNEHTPFLTVLTFYGVLINVSLALFNMLPIGPLDGMWLFSTFLPERLRYGFVKWNLTTGQFVFLAIVIMGQLTNVSLISSIIQPPLMFVVKFLLGL